MGGLLQSARLFFGGILRRFYYWLPTVFLDPFDFWERYARARVPEAWRGIEVPSDAFFPALGGTLLWAALLTYHELRTQADRERRGLKGQIENRQQRQAIAAQLAALIDDGDAIAQAVRRSGDDERYGSWSKQAEAFLARECGASAASDFRTARVPSLRDPFAQHTSEVWMRLNRVTAQVEALKRIKDRYDSPS